MFIEKRTRTKAARKRIKAAGTTTLLAVTMAGCAANTVQQTLPDVSVDTTTNVETSNTPTNPAIILPTIVANTPTIAPTIAPTTVPTQSAPVLETNGSYVDGVYSGDAIRTDRWGYTEVRAVIEDGMLVNVEIVNYPTGKRRSAQISQSAFPALISEAISNQSADVDIVTRATDTSVAFIRSLDTALQDAHVGNNT
jgi:uncharacterized protein with FMN-binding domain